MNAPIGENNTLRHLLQYTAWVSCMNLVKFFFKKIPSSFLQFVDVVQQTVLSVMEETAFWCRAWRSIIKIPNFVRTY